MSTALVPVGELERMAKAVAASKLFGITNVEQAMALMLVAQAEGLHPATAARDYHIVQGRPTLKADAMLARYLSSGGKVEWHEHTDTKVAATFTHPQGGSLKIDWDMARAKAAGLGGKDMWAKYPRQMLRARVISEGVRATNPAVAVGVYTPEEAQDFTPARREPRDMGRAEVVDQETGEITVPPAAESIAKAKAYSRNPVGDLPADKLEQTFTGIDPIRADDAKALDACLGLDTLKEEFGERWNASKGDAARRSALKAVYEDRKAKLTPPAVDPFVADMERAEAHANNR